METFDENRRHSVFEAFWACWAIEPVAECTEVRLWSELSVVHPAPTMSIAYVLSDSRDHTSCHSYKTESVLDLTNGQMSLSVPAIGHENFGYEKIAWICRQFEGLPAITGTVLRH